jgi:hypothetical protein
MQTESFTTLTIVAGLMAIWASAVASLLAF